jgi:hypothetical protein
MNVQAERVTQQELEYILHFTLTWLWIDEDLIEFNIFHVTPSFACNRGSSLVNVGGTKRSLAVVVMWLLWRETNDQHLLLWNLSLSSLHHKSKTLVVSAHSFVYCSSFVRVCWTLPLKLTVGRKLLLYVHKSNWEKIYF